MADIFHDIEEGLRQDRLKKLWRKFRWPLIGLILLIVGAVVALVLVKDVTETRKLEQAERFSNALEIYSTGDSKAAAKAFSSLAFEAEDPGYLVFSSFRSAQAHIESDKINKAISIFDDLAGNAEVLPLYRELAVFFAADLLLDTVTYEEINQRLAPIMLSESVWRPMAQEVVALAALKSGNVDRARELFQELTLDALSPPGIKERAKKFLANIGGIMQSPEEGGD